ncbi:MAG: hypothetical protein ACJ708_05610, partial [Nitrososphaeraceae archaeon]
MIETTKPEKIRKVKMLFLSKMMLNVLERKVVVIFSEICNKYEKEVLLALFFFYNSNLVQV